jgi:zinc/manganese transport system ATP-binding protein
VALVDDVRRQQGITVLLVAHDVNPLLRHVDGVLYLAGGRAAAGTPQQVIRSDVLTRLYGTQVEVFAAAGRLFVAAVADS